MTERLANILRAGVILIVLTVWLPTAAVLVAPHENRWVERTLETARITRRCPSGKIAVGDRCRRDYYYQARFDWDGWVVLGPVTLVLLAGLYFVSGSLSLRIQREQEAAEEE